MRSPTISQELNVILLYSMVGVSGEIMGDCKVEPGRMDGWYTRVAECVEGSMEITIVAGFVHRRQFSSELCRYSKMYINPDAFF